LAKNCGKYTTGLGICPRELELTEQYSTDYYKNLFSRASFYRIARKKQLVFGMIFIKKKDL
jgi:hypothetical protein